MLVFLFRCLVYGTPLACIAILLRWSAWVERKLLRSWAEAELTREFGTKEVSVGSVRLRFGSKGSVVCEIRDSVVGADFLKVSLVRVTARGARAFLSCTGIGRVLRGYMVCGFPLRDVDSIEVDGLSLHIVEGLKNAQFYQEHIAAQKNKARRLRAAGKEELHTWRSQWTTAHQQTGVAAGTVDDDGTTTDDGTVSTEIGRPLDDDGGDDDDQQGVIGRHSVPSSSPSSCKMEDNDNNDDDKVDNDGDDDGVMVSKENYGGGSQLGVSGGEEGSPSRQRARSTTDVEATTTTGRARSSSRDQGQQMCEGSDGILNNNGKTNTRHQPDHHHHQQQHPPHHRHHHHWNHHHEGNDDEEDDDDDGGHFGIVEEMAHFGTASVAELFLRLRKKQAARKSAHLRELSEWTHMVQRVNDAATVRCGLVRCTNFEVSIKVGGGKQRSFKLGNGSSSHHHHAGHHYSSSSSGGGGGGSGGGGGGTDDTQAVSPSSPSSASSWELRAFVGTYTAFRHAVLFEVRPTHPLGLVPTLVKDSGKERVLETVANLKEKVLEKKDQLRHRVEKVKEKQAELRQKGAALVHTVEESRLGQGIGNAKHGIGKLLGTASSHVVSHVKEHVSNRWQQHHHGSPSLPAMASSAQQETQSPGPRSSPPMSPQSPVSPSTASSPQAPQVPPPPSYQTSSPSSPGNQGTGGRQLFQAMAKARASKESVNE